MKRPGTTANVVELAYAPGFDWSAMLAFIAPRVIPGVEAILDNHYQRCFRLDDGLRGWFKVGDCPEQGCLRLSIFHEAGNPPPKQIEQRVRSIFDLDTDMAPILRALEQDPLLAPAIQAHPGLRMPGTWDPFEFIVRAILGQQISVKAATTLAGRVASRCGPECGAGYPQEQQTFFPTAEEVCLADLSGIGITSKRQTTIKGLAHCIAEKSVSLSDAQGLEHFVASLTSLPGIGPWTAQYVAMRALKIADAFPDTDLGVKKALLENGRMPTSTQAVKRAEAWRPWRAYATLFLWKRAELSTPHCDLPPPS